LDKISPKGVFIMPDMFNLTPQMQEYFNSLPEMVQESIIQSGAKINSLEDLKAVAKGEVGNEQ
jgi:hypothetical protein